MFTGIIEEALVAHHFFDGDLLVELVVFSAVAVVCCGLRFAFVGDLDLAYLSKDDGWLLTWMTYGNLRLGMGKTMTRLSYPQSHLRV